MKLVMINDLNSRDLNESILYAENRNCDLVECSKFRVISGH